MRGLHHAPAALYLRKTPVSIVQEAGWAPGPVWTGAENLAATGIRSPDRSARSQSLYSLRYLRHAGKVEVKLHPLLISALEGHELSASRLVALLPAKEPPFPND